MEEVRDIEFVKFLIGRKKPDIAEIELTLFENCNINCSFCGHDKKSKVGLSESEMLSKIPVVEGFLDTVDKDVSQINLHLVGGELLQDRLINKSILSSYTALIKEYCALCERKGIEANIIVVSNFLMKEVSKVKDWLDELRAFTNVSLIASYDPFGRPMNDDYFYNLEFLKNYISNINMVLTKQCVEALKKGDKVFEELYQKYPIFVDDFLPDESSEDMIPSEKDFSDYLGLVGSKFPDLMPYGDAVKYLDSGAVNHIQFTTFNKCTIFPDGSISNYLWKRHTPNLFDIEIDYDDNSNMLLNYIEKNSCFSCKFYSACPLRCPVSWSWRGAEERGLGCSIKTFFEGHESRKGESPGL